MADSQTAIVWLRRDLRLDDNVALYDACRQSERVCLAFVLNPPLLESDRIGAPLVSVFFDALRALRTDLRKRGSDLAILRGGFIEELRLLARRVGASAVFYNEDYEPAARTRDAAVTEALEEDGIAVAASLDHVYFGANEVTRPDGESYRMFTPYKRRWLEQRAVSARRPVPSAKVIEGKLLSRSTLGETQPAPELREFGFQASPSYPHAGEAIALRRLRDFLGGGIEGYADDRNTPAIDGTSRLSAQLRAGTIGIRACVEQAFAKRDASGGHARTSADAWIAQLVWRDFYQTILRRFPNVETAPFIAAGARIAWRDPGEAFERWCRGCTGYPIVDAAMRQLNTTGWMHNRLRMITASFLTKHLLIDWKMGERYFAQRLADADLAQNNGGWQWASSTGTDAAPYFRIFNPVLQSKKFDPQGTFIKRMIPELEAMPANMVHEPWLAPLTAAYPPPIVDHAIARDRAIRVFKAALG